MTPMTHLVPLSGSSGRVTASDRLEADKAKYVKSPQVIHRRQNPAINTKFTPVLSRKASLLPPLQTEYSFNNLCSSTTQQKSRKQSDSDFDKSNDVFQTSPISSPLIPEEKFKPKTVQSHSSSLSPSVPRKQANLSFKPQKEQTSSPNCKCPLSPSFLTSNHGNHLQTTPGSPTASPHCLRRLSGKRMNRPDSLIIYRQKRDVALSSKENSNEEAGLVIRLLQGTPLLKRSSRFSQNPAQTCNQEVPLSPQLPRGKEKAFVCQSHCPTTSNVQEVQLEEQLTFTDYEAQTFFESCGLEGSLLNLLNSYQKGGNTPMGSLESMDRVSCALGVAEEEKEVKTPVSVIERNARVIKWIYSCHQARSIGGQGNKQLARESTV
ncbi:protein FAM110D [Hyla sarda]|uniref:protein FAM110D n=1 Tax=Hyla sarda TaxID=327740 RepID=UPI0024C30779|nr:protein FAM110D [Hyla sarda]XP_056416622.1 protein FAM110D [Hyla sarda]XP_056416623.1 protein FAM110D [Hyla sarda]XP_056416624.1 protein FAM110D [Hyla sarda]XP_056416625.1 protein FAM110D [Hyla sarda]XP_056416626.1 protein FAM110D [Hyla sarda]